MSTLLSELDSNGPAGGDEDLVQKIMMEMGGGGGGGGYGQQPQGGYAAGPPPPMLQPPLQPQPPVGGMSGGGVINVAPNQQMPPQIMDPVPPTAHMIGGSHPTPADFAAAMGGSPNAAWAPAGPSPQEQARYVVSSGSKRGGFFAKLSNEIRTPALVAILVFAFSLPVVNFLFAHYLPRFVKPTGELSPLGLLLKSIAAGATFWVLNSVIVPLLRV